jgi:hypothetical protein
VIQAAGNDTLLASIPLCLFASAYIAIDVCDRWPTNTDIRQIAKSAAESETGLDITEQEIYEYLSLVALGTLRLDDVFSAEGVTPIPLFATANLLLTFCPKEKHWWEYLDQMWGRQGESRSHQPLRPPCPHAPRPQGAQEHSLRQSKYYRQVFMDIAHPYD